MIPHQVPGLGLREVLVEDPVQPARFVDVSVDAVLDALRRVPDEVVGLALHGTQARVLEEEPVGHLVVFARALGEGDLVVWVVLLGEILQDATRLEQTDLLAVTEGVGQGGDTAVGVDLEKPAAIGGQFGRGLSKSGDPYSSFCVFLEISIFSTL